MVLKNADSLPNAICFDQRQPAQSAQVELARNCFSKCIKAFFNRTWLQYKYLTCLPYKTVVIDPKLCKAK